MALRRDAFGALRSRQYRRWFFGQILSASGTSTQAAGQGWLIVELHGGGLALAAATGALFLPSLLFGAHFGELCDRHDRRAILLITRSVQAAITGALAGLTAAGVMTIGLLIVMALAMGVAFAADSPAQQVYVMDLIGRDNVAGAISLNEVVLNASRALGPALGGVIIAVSSVWVCFLVNSLTFLPTLAVLASQRPPAGRRQPAPAERGSVRAGIRYALSAPLIRACLLMGVTSGAVISVQVVVPLLATRVFHVGGAEYGLMLASFGLGAVPGAICAAASGPSPSGRQVRWLGLITGIVVVGCAAAPVLPLVLFGLLAVGMFSIWLIARANALVLLAAEDGMRGRVMGVWSAALPGMNPLTGLLLGSSADAWGPRAAYGGVGVAAALAALAGWHALRRQRTAPLTEPPRRTAQPSMEDLRTAPHQHLQLAVREQSEAVIIPRLSAPHAPGLVSQVGGRLPLLCSAASTVLLSRGGIRRSWLDRWFRKRSRPPAAPAYSRQKGALHGRRVCQPASPRP